MGIADNFAFAEVTPETIGAMTREVAAMGCDAIVILCTNMNGAAISARLETELNVRVLDSVAVTLWACLGAVGLDPGIIKGWGGVFQIPA